MLRSLLVKDHRNPCSTEKGAERPQRPYLQRELLLVQATLAPVSQTLRIVLFLCMVSAGSEPLPLNVGLNLRMLGFAFCVTMAIAIPF
jgi:hypothetical protein